MCTDIKTWQILVLLALTLVLFTAVIFLIIAIIKSYQTWQFLGLIFIISILCPLVTIPSLELYMCYLKDKLKERQ